MFPFFFPSKARCLALDIDPFLLFTGLFGSVRGFGWPFLRLRTTSFVFSFTVCFYVFGFASTRWLRLALYGVWGRNLFGFEDAKDLKWIDCVSIRFDEVGDDGIK